MILASDTRATFPKSNVRPHDECGKQWHLLPFRCAACAAGRLSIAQPVADELSNQFVRLSNPRRKRLYTGHIARAINEARFTVFREMVSWSLKKTYCLSLQEWQTGRVPSGKLDRLLLEAGKVLIQNELKDFSVELIVGGFLGNHQLVFYKVSRMRHLEASSAPGVFAIGTGGVAAMNHLNSRGQNADCSLARSLLHVTEAVAIARLKNPDTVGRPSHFVVIWKDGTMKRFDPNCPAMRNWKKVYKHRTSTWGLQNSKVADVEVKSQMIEHEPR